MSDAQYTVPTSTGATVEVDLASSRLGLPVSLLPGATALTETQVAPRISATTVAVPAAREAAEGRPRVPLG